MTAVDRSAEFAQDLHSVTYFTANHELEAFLDDKGVCYEVIDGAIVVNAYNTFDHEDASGGLFAALRTAAPVELAVVGPHLGFHYQEGSYLLPDIVVARRADCRPDGIHVAPLLVVEVLSPSTRWTDLGRKQEIYEQAGVPSYWVVDPVDRTLIVLSLQEGGYAESARLTGEGELAVEQPFTVTVRPFPTMRSD